MPTVADVIRHLQALPPEMEVFDQEFSGTQPTTLDNIKVVRVIKRSAELWELIYYHHRDLTDEQLCAQYHTSLDKITRVVILG